MNVQTMAVCQDNVIDEAQFDSLVEQIVTENKHFVVDNGAASFVPMSNYIIQNDVVDVLSQADRQVMVHVVISGGLGLANTVSDFVQLAKQLPESAKIVVWLNEYFGKLQGKGKTFEEMKAYQANKDRVTGIVRLTRWPGSLFGQDISQMLDSRLTFEEALEHKDFRLMSNSA